MALPRRDLCATGAYFASFAFAAALMIGANKWYHGVAGVAYTESLEGTAMRIFGGAIALVLFVPSAESRANCLDGATNFAINPSGDPEHSGIRFTANRDPQDNAYLNKKIIRLITLLVKSSNSYNC